MTKLTLQRSMPRLRAALAVFALAALSLPELGAKGASGKSGGPGLFWPVVGIAAVLIATFVASKFVRGDPYYEQNASRDRRDAGPAPWGGHGGDGGDDGGGMF